MTSAPSLPALGWRAGFARQIELETESALRPARVLSVHRNAFLVAGDGFERSVPPHADTTVGDWVLLNSETDRVARRLDRQSLFKRRAPGTGRDVQLIAANVDTLFVVSSCNQDFNIARLERYLALARDAGVMPVVVLTKADLADDPRDFARRAETLLANLLVETLDARDPAPADALLTWCGPGQTVALLGSSGTGKSTLVNTLAGADAATQTIREDDAKGRHTTTARALHALPSGGWLLDTPGMRELQLTDAQEGIEQVFDDIATRAAQCRFSDCRHESEPGCAVQAAISRGELEAARLVRYRKLQAEERFNSETLAERRARDKSFGKMVRKIISEKQDR